MIFELLFFDTIVSFYLSFKVHKSVNLSFTNTFFRFVFVMLFSLVRIKWPYKKAYLLSIAMPEI